MAGDAEEDEDHEELEWDEDELHDRKKNVADAKKGKTKVEKDHKVVQETVAASHSKPKSKPKKSDKSTKAAEVSAKEAAALKKAKEKTAEALKLKAAAAAAKKKIKELEAAAAAAKKAKEIEKSKAAAADVAGAAAAKKIKELEKTKAETTDTVHTSAIKAKSKGNAVENLLVSPKHDTQTSDETNSVDAITNNSLLPMKAAEETKINPTPIPNSYKDNPLPRPVEFLQHAPVKQTYLNKQNSQTNPNIISHNERLLDSSRLLNGQAQPVNEALETNTLQGPNHQAFQGGQINGRNNQMLGMQQKQISNNKDRFENANNDQSAIPNHGSVPFQSGGDKSTSVIHGEYEQRETEPNLPVNNMRNSNDREGESFHKYEDPRNSQDLQGPRDQRNTHPDAVNWHEMNSNRDGMNPRESDMRNIEGNGANHGNFRDSGDSQKTADQAGSNGENLSSHMKSSLDNRANNEPNSHFDRPESNTFGDPHTRDPHDNFDISNNNNHNSNDNNNNNFRNKYDNNDISSTNSNNLDNNNFNKKDNNNEPGNNSHNDNNDIKNRGPSNEGFHRDSSPNDDNYQANSLHGDNPHHEFHGRNGPNNEKNHQEGDEISHELGNSGSSQYSSFTKSKDEFRPPGNPRPSNAQLQQQIPEGSPINEHHGSSVTDPDKNPQMIGIDHPSENTRINDNSPKAPSKNMQDALTEKQKDFLTVDHNIGKETANHDLNEVHDSSSHSVAKESPLIVFKDNSNSNTDVKENSNTINENSNKEEEGLSQSNDPILQKIREELRSGGNEIGGAGANTDSSASNGNQINSMLSDQNKDLLHHAGNLHLSHPGAGTMQDLESLMSGSEQKEIVPKHSKCVECRESVVNAKTRTELNGMKRPDYELVFVKAPNPNYNKKTFPNNYLRKKKK